jgi:hypothetical protein
MTQQVIFTGTVANDGTGDGLRTAFGKVNSNFTELYASSNMASPNIAYTGVFNGYPATISVTRGQGIFFTNTNTVLETTGKYWWDGEFDTNNYDLSGIETLNFYNLGGIKLDFRLGGKSENFLTDVNLRDIVAIGDDFYIRDLPALDTFSANNLAYVGNNFQIDTMDNANTQFNFPNLKTIINSFYYTYNDTLENTPQFPALETVQNSMYIYFNGATQNTMTFDSLRYVGYLNIYQNDGMLAGPEFPALTSMGGFDMNNNEQMIDPPTFPVLETVTGSFNFYSNDSVTTAPSTPSLVSCSAIQWYDNSLMANGFNFSSLKEVNGNANFSGNALNETTVNYILTTFAGLNGANGTTSYDSKIINVSGGTNAIPSGNGLTAITTLEGRGCTVNYNAP